MELHRHIDTITLLPVEAAAAPDPEDVLHNLTYRPLGPIFADAFEKAVNPTSLVVQQEARSGLCVLADANEPDTDASVLLWQPPHQGMRMDILVDPVDQVLATTSNIAMKRVASILGAFDRSVQSGYDVTSPQLQIVVVPVRPVNATVVFKRWYRHLLQVIDRSASVSHVPMVRRPLL